MTIRATEVKQATVEDLLDLGIQLEAGLQRLYQEFAGMFGHCPEVAAFWRVLAVDEASHKNRLIQARSVLCGERLARAADAKTVREAQRLLDVEMRERPGEVRNLDDAYELANDLESSETNTIFRFFLSELHPDVSVASILMRDLDVHVERLMTGFPAEYATRTQRLAVKPTRS
ncbi:MAG: ferritin family protein [Phycisphaerales bacterium]